MKHTKSQLYSKSHCVAQPRFEEQDLTSFSGLILFQLLFKKLDLKSRLRNCLDKTCAGTSFNSSSIILILIVHITLGYRKLSDVNYYRDDPLVKQ